MKKLRPIVAPGWMSMPVRLLASSEMIRAPGRDDRRAEPVERVRDPVVQDRDDAGVADQDLVRTAGRRIAEECRADVVVDQFADRPQFRAEQAHDHARMAHVERQHRLFLPIGELAFDLPLQPFQRLPQPRLDERILALDRPCEHAEPPGKQRGDEIVERATGLVQRREARDAMTAVLLLPPCATRAAQFVDRRG
jgi:hypothetical protein